MPQAARSCSRRRFTEQPTIDGLLDKGVAKTENALGLPADFGKQAGLAQLRDRLATRSPPPSLTASSAGHENSGPSTEAADNTSPR